MVVSFMTISLWEARETLRDRSNCPARGLGDASGFGLSVSLEMGSECDRLGSYRLISQA